MALASACRSSARLKGSVRTGLVPFLMEGTVVEGVASTTAATSLRRVSFGLALKRRRWMGFVMGIEPRVHEEHGCIATVAIDNCKLLLYCENENKNIC